MVQFHRRSLLRGTAAAGAALIVRPAAAADYKFRQYHNQAASGTLHKNLTATGRPCAKKARAASTSACMLKTTNCKGAIWRH